MFSFIKKIWSKVADDTVKKVTLGVETMCFFLGLIILIASIITANSAGITIGIALMIVAFIFLIVTVLISYCFPHWTICCKKINLPQVNV
jgi:hypothetical protein